LISSVFISFTGFDFQKSQKGHLALHLCVTERLRRRGTGLLRIKFPTNDFKAFRMGNSLRGYRMKQFY
jgi:hypothetical protein